MTDASLAWMTPVVREHFSSPLLQLAEQDGGKTFVLVECPSSYNHSLCGLYL